MSPARTATDPESCGEGGSHAASSDSGHRPDASKRPGQDHLVERAAQLANPLEQGSVTERIAP